MRAVGLLPRFLSSLPKVDDLERVPGRELDLLEGAHQETARVPGNAPGEFQIRGDGGDHATRQFMEAEQESDHAQCDREGWGRVSGGQVIVD
jgi:hypothetical protein